MPRSQQLLEVLTKVISDDARSPFPVVNYFLNNDLSGGWEGWLQVAYARAVLGSLPEPADFEREVTFDGTTQRCDLLFTPVRGARMWVELKTQRRVSYRQTINDFMADIDKLYFLAPQFKQANVLIAAAVMRLQDDDARRLNTLRAAVRGGNLHYSLFTPGAFEEWTDVTETISTTQTGRDDLLLATYQVY
jgi:hypothetical protein